MAHNKDAGPPKPLKYNRNTGYSANIRPQNYYSLNLDKLDFPEFIPCMENVNKSITKMSFPFRKYDFNVKKCSKNDKNSGFNKGVPNTLPKHDDVYKLYYNTRTHKSLPKTIPVREDKDPIEDENNKRVSQTLR